MQTKRDKMRDFFDKLMYKLWAMIFRILKKEITDKFYFSFMQFVKFAFIGVTNTIISYFIYLVVLLLFQKYSIFLKTDYLIAQIIAFALSVLWSFYWNNKFVFVSEKERKRSWWRSLLKTYISYSFTGLFLNSVLLILWVRVFGISEFIAPIINLLISVPLNFILNKFWAFK